MQHNFMSREPYDFIQLCYFKVSSLSIENLQRILYYDVFRGCFASFLVSNYFNRTDSNINQNILVVILSVRRQIYGMPHSACVFIYETTIIKFGTTNIAHFA